MDQGIGAYNGAYNFESFVCLFVWPAARGCGVGTGDTQEHMAVAGAS
jgi:hypothetical protein